MGKFSEYNLATDLSINDWILALRTLSGNELAVQKASFSTVATCLNTQYKSFVSVTGNYTCLLNQRLYINITSSATLTLPAVTVDADARFLGIEIILTTASNIFLTINPNGKPINSKTGNRTISCPAGAYINLIYINSSIGWIDTSNTFGVSTLADSYLHCGTYTGNAQNRNIAITVDTPDLILFHYLAAYAPRWSSPLLGLGYNLPWLASSNLSAYQTDAWTGYGSDGYSLNIGVNGYYNTNAAAYRLWAFRASRKGGLSVIRYTGTGAVRTIEHALGVQPSLVVIKGLTGSYRWYSYLRNLSGEETKWVPFDSGTEAPTVDATVWNNTKTDANNITLGTSVGVNALNVNYVCFAWAESTNFTMQFYTGSGTAQVIALNFTPTIFGIRRLQAGYYWYWIDTYTSGFYLAADGNYSASYSTHAVSTTNGVSLLSNNASFNENGISYVVIAFR